MLLSASGGTKGCFMASIKGGKRSRQTWSSAGQDEQTERKRKEGFKHSPASRRILMANLLSSVLPEMIRARCFQKSAHFWICLVCTDTVTACSENNGCPNSEMCWHLVVESFPWKKAFCAVCGSSAVLISGC